MKAAGGRRQHHGTDFFLLKISKVISVKQLVLTVLIGFTIGSCSPTAQLNNEREDITQYINLFLILDGNQGDCVQSYKVGEENGRLTCSRASRTQCQVDIKFDPNGNLIVREETRTRRLAEWNALNEDHEECTNTIASLLITSTYNVTAEEDKTDIQSRNVLTVIDACESLMNDSIDSLVNEDEYAFLISSRGLLAIQAGLLNNSACLDNILRSTEERELIDGIISGNRLLETRCFYGSNAFFSVCNDQEKAQAAPFDFSTPL